MAEHHNTQRPAQKAWGELEFAQPELRAVGLGADCANREEFSLPPPVRRIGRGLKKITFLSALRIECR